MAYRPARCGLARESPMTRKPARLRRLKPEMISLVSIASGLDHSRPGPRTLPRFLQVPHPFGLRETGGDCTHCAGGRNGHPTDGVACRMRGTRPRRAMPRRRSWSATRSRLRRTCRDFAADKAQNKRWTWIRKGAPIICEIGAREVRERKVAYLRRDEIIAADGKIDTRYADFDVFLHVVEELLESIQTGLFERADAFLRDHLYKNTRSFVEVEALFESGKPAWAQVSWSRPSGAALDEVLERLKPLKVTMRVVPFDQGEIADTCLFTGLPAIENVILARAY
jgi:hypothetical protein